jgi:hypothetical protein
MGYPGRRIVLTDAQLEQLVERAVERGVARALASAPASISSRGEEEDPTCDDQESMDHIDTDNDGDSSWSTKEGSRLLSLMRRKKQPKKQRQMHISSKPSKTG